MTDTETSRSKNDAAIVAVVMGVSGVGKTTVGISAAERLDWEFIDGDDVHPDANVKKMSDGIPLTDVDREEWLKLLKELIAERLRDGRRAIVACSALKRTYRARLLDAGDGVVIIYLRASHEVVEARIQARKGHFFDPRLLASQYAALEEPTDAITVDATQPVDGVVDEVVRRLERLAGTGA